jgi:hypothetical protein
MKEWKNRRVKIFKSITVNATTFDAVERLTETLLPNVKLSKAQVVENLVKEFLEKIPQDEEKK